MSIEDDELEGEGGSSEDQQERRSIIAAPGIASEMPAVSLRGLSSPTPAPGSTEDLENRAASSRIQPRPIAAPSPLQTRTAADEAEYGRLQSTGSGISQIHNPVARYALRGLETIGGILAPRTTSMIPGTELHHDALMNQARGRIGEDLGESQKIATTEETGARTEQAEAAAEKDRAEAADKRNPKTGLTPEETTIHDLMTGENGVPRINPETGKPYTYLEAYTAVQEAKQSTKPAKPERPDTPEQQFIDEYQRVHKGASVADALAAYAKVTQKPEQPQRPQQVLGITPDHKVIEIRPGMNLPEGTQTVTGEIKAEQGQEGKNAATNYANDYLNRKVYTGPGDEALMEKFFEMAKPSSGFRMTEAQMAMLRNAQGWMNSFSARAHHALYGTWFSDDQRQQIVDTMNELGQTGARPGHGGTQRFTDNGVIYNIPADKVDAFKKDHPHAQ